MKVSRVKYSNILGLDEFEFTAGAGVNLIKGENAAGKSSALRGLIEALGSGSQAKLLRNGTDQGEVVIIFDDKVCVRARVTEQNGVQRTAWDAEGVEIPRFQTWLKERLNVVSFNPVRFLRGTPQERLDFLLSVAPLHLTVATLKAACPAAEILASSVDKEGEIKDPLKVLAALDTQMRERRTMVGRESKKKKGFADELETTLPAGVPEDCAELLEGTRNQLAAVKSERMVQERKIDKTEQDLIGQANDILAQRESQLKADAQAAIDRIAAQLVSDLTAARETAENDRQTVRDDAKQVRKDRLGALQVKETALVEEVARQEQIVEQQSRSNTTRALLKQAKDEVREHDKNYEALSKSIKAIDGIRAGLFAEMPISGLAVKDGAIFVDDVDYDTLNGANQVRVAFQLAKAASPGGIVCLDGGLAELDNKHREFFDEWAQESGLQFFLSEVAPDGTPLTVEAAK